MTLVVLGPFLSFRLRLLIFVRRLGSRFDSWAFKRRAGVSYKRKKPLGVWAYALAA